MATQAELTLFSPAKINLYLRITGRRPDGYHALETVMLPLDFGDQLTFRPHPTGQVLECDHPGLPVDPSNLALRAARALDSQRGVKIHLCKRTPLAAGLGGGSSNAATVLRGLNQFWQLDIPPGRLDQLAAGMGSDINFFLQPHAALCTGRGEQIRPVECRLSATVLLINPGFGISTKWAYASWAQAAARSPEKPLDVNRLLRALADDDLPGVAASLFNSLEAPSIRKFPILALLKDALRTGGAAGAMMSGSGATVFGLFADSAAADRTAAHIRAEFGPSMWTQPAHLFCG